MKKEITVRIWKKETDYPLAAEWWKKRGCAADYIPLPQYLPRAGFVAECEGRPVAMTWLLYYLDVPAAQLGYIITNPDNPASVSYAAGKALLEECGRVADDHRIRLVGRYGARSILSLLENCGWEPVVDAQTEMIRYPRESGLQSVAAQPTKEALEGG